MAYAEGTSVPIDKSIGEIRTLLRNAGAERLAQAETPGRLAVQCFLEGRMLRFAVELPGAESIPKRNGRGSERTINQIADLVKQRHRQRARALLLVVKGKLESFESGVESFDEAFLANVVMPDGQTVADKTIPQIAPAYLDGGCPPLLLGN